MNVGWTRRGFACALALGAMGAASGTLGCNKIAQALKKRVADAGAAAAAEIAMGEEAERDAAIVDKVDPFTRCLNALSGPVHQSRQRYFSFVPRSGPTGRETFADLFPLPEGAALACETGVAKAKANAPSEPALEQAGDDFAAAATELERVTAEADRYFEAKQFKQDRWARGKAFHTRLVATWSRFVKAEEALHVALDAITQPLAERVLARIEKEDGKRLRYHRKSVLMTARALIEVGDPIGDDDDIDTARYAAAYTAYEKAIDALEAYGRSHDDELVAAEATTPGAKAHYVAFVKESGDFKDAAKDYWQCLRDAPAKAKSPSGKVDLDKLATCGSTPAWKKAGAVVTQYNEFIRTSNGHPFP